MIKIYKGQID